MGRLSSKFGRHRAKAVSNVFSLQEHNNLPLGAKMVDHLHVMISFNIFFIILSL